MFTSFLWYSVIDHDLVHVYLIRNRAVLTVILTTRIWNHDRVDPDFKIAHTCLTSSSIPSIAHTSWTYLHPTLSNFLFMESSKSFFYTYYQFCSICTLRLFSPSLLYLLPGLVSHLLSCLCTLVFGDVIFCLCLLFVMLLIRGWWLRVLMMKSISCRWNN